MPDEKNDELIRVWMGSSLLAELEQLARADRRKVSEYVRVVLERHVYGHSATAALPMQSDE